MKKIVFLIILLLIPSVMASYLIITPFSECRGIGLKLEIQEEIDALQKEAFRDDLPPEEKEKVREEFYNKLKEYEALGEECCSLTIDEGKCKAMFMKKYLNKIMWQGILVLGILLFIASIVYMFIGKKIVKNEQYDRRIRVLAKLIIGIGILLLVLFLYAMCTIRLM